jgi:porin
MAIGAAGLATAPAGRAQQVPGTQTNSGTGIGPSNQLTAPRFEDTAVTLPSTEHLFDDWAGLRSGLLSRGIDVGIDNTNEFAGNVTGGAKKNATNAGQVGVEVDVDWEKLGGIKGLSTHVVIVGRYGASASNGFGDNLSPVQEIYGSGGNVLAKLVYAYGEETLFHNRLDLAFGRMPVGGDFAASPLNCTFMNNIMCGNPKALVGNVAGFSAWPSSTWGVRARYRPVPSVYVEAGIYEVSRAVYGNAAGYRSNWTINTDRDAGGEFPVEVGWEPRFGREQLPGHYRLGMAWDTSAYPVWGADISKGAIDITKQPQKYQRTNDQFWALMDQMVVRNGSGANDGLIVLAGYIHDNADVLARSDQAYVGLYEKDFWHRRPDDIIGFLYTHQTISGRLSGEQALEAELGLTLADGATGVQRFQDLLELNYTIHVMNGVTFEPDVQYIFKPNAEVSIPDAAVFGFRSHISF